MLHTQWTRVIFEIGHLENISSMWVVQELLSECRISLSQCPMNDYQCLYRNLHKDTQISGPKLHLFSVGNIYIDELSSYMAQQRLDQNSFILVQMLSYNLRINPTWINKTTIINQNQEI